MNKMKQTTLCNLISIYFIIKYFTHKLVALKKTIEIRLPCYCLKHCLEFDESRSTVVWEMTSKSRSSAIAKLKFLTITFFLKSRVKKLDACTS